MLHHELLRQLCLARGWLRELEDEALSVDAIARRAGIAPHHFIRLFRAVFGETPHRYRSLSRIQHAKHLLLLTDQTVTDVCMAVGFSSLGSFSTLFKRHVGVSPAAFQRRHRAGSTRPDALPAALTPGCLCLMAAAFRTQKSNFREASAPSSR